MKLVIFVYGVCLMYGTMFNTVFSADFNRPLDNTISDKNLHTAGHGTVSMPGSIIDSACAIATDSINQTVTLKLSSTYALKASRFGRDEDLLIKLVNCTTKKSDGHSEWKNIYITFLGDAVPANESLFSLAGDIRGVGIQIRTDDNVIINPSQKYKVDATITPSLTLRYKIRLAAVSNDMRNGLGNLTIRLKLDYD